ncbi:UNVERIFIED_ORG: protein gp37 [Sphingomonas sp. R1F5B]
MADTAIEWATKVWNPVVGCSLQSPGCTNCYAMRMAWRLQNMASKADGTGNFHLDHYLGTVQQSKGGPVWTGQVNVAPDDAFLAPLRRKKPTDYFVNSMSDLFHPAVPFDVVDRVFAVMALCPQHMFKILTKRSDRMREYFAGNKWGWRVINAKKAIDPKHVPGHGGILATTNGSLPNVWLGVSVEDQRRADERIPDLLATPAAVRFLSCEPLLGPVDLTDLTIRVRPGEEPCGLAGLDALTGVHWDAEDTIPGIYGNPDPCIDWVIVGGESGPGARPMHPDWARALRDQCAAAGVPFHFKQHGTWAEVFDRDRDDPDWRDCGRWAHEYPKGRWLNLAGGHGFHGERVLYVAPVGKKAAGRLLDGIEHNGMPEVHHG